MKQGAVISPSGNYYGSEQVLHDWLESSQPNCLIFVPKGSKFENLLREASGKEIKPFCSVYTLYLQLAWLLFIGQVQWVYCNEGAHVRYIKILSSLFKQKRFVLHVRIAEDLDRISHNRPANLSYITISKYMQKLASNPMDFLFVYDPYKFEANKSISNLDVSDYLQVAIIGRISTGKGLHTLVRLARAVQEQNMKIHLNLYGNRVETPDSQSLFNELDQMKGLVLTEHSFVEKDKIYDSNHVVLHLAKREPLGRIFFEALDNFKPIVGFNTGGIGELSQLCQLNDFLIDDDDATEVEQILERLRHIEANYKASLKQISDARTIAKNLFTQNEYNHTLTQIIDKQL